ncbi:VOC family protein [Nocardioides sp. BYT-33-1]|uniref:VOC family protein n=1 Tax=Nocardioides sp. BYT-33-1 TaxID=3416952 RepID=UPI003F53A3B2
MNSHGENRPTVTTRGVDHLGLTVPDIDAATDFFVSAFGAQLLYETLDGPAAGALLEQSLGIPSGATVQRVRMLRLANGPSLELFEYGNVSQREPLRACDYGIQHFALYVDDLDTALAAMVEAGARPLAAPEDLPGMEAGEGNRWLYAELPWGGLIELVTAPSPQAYETTTSLRRWRPTPI